MYFSVSLVKLYFTIILLLWMKLQMNVFNKTVVAAVLAFYTSISFAFVTGKMPVAPSGWSLKENNTNVRIYQKGTEQTYVQVVDIKGGAKIRFSHPGKLSGTPLTFYKYTLDTHWSSIPYNDSLRMASMVNGQFFNNDTDPTILSFGVRANSSLLTLGITEAISKKQIEFFDGSGVYVGGVNNTNLKSGLAQNIIVGLDPSVSKNASIPLGRMYMCSKVNPYVGASPSQWLVILSAQWQIQATALANITSWGCDINSIVMFDGSGSSQLKTTGGIRMIGSNGLKAENRTLPQTVVVYNF
jgi:hypothetical protein